MSKNNLLLKILTLGQFTSLYELKCPLSCKVCYLGSIFKVWLLYQYNFKMAPSGNVNYKVLQAKKKSLHPMDCPRNLLRVDLLITLKARPSSLRTHSCHNILRRCFVQTNVSTVFELHRLVSNWARLLSELLLCVFQCSLLSSRYLNITLQGFILIISLKNTLWHQYKISLCG